jgi:hypothetical protein
MMIYEKIYYETQYFWVWKCVYCGECIDQVILENRKIQKSNRERSGKNSEGPVHGSNSRTPSV